MVVPDREEGGGHLAFAPALTGRRSYGDTIDQAVAYNREAIAGCLESLKAEGEPPPIADIPIKPVETAGRCYHAD